MHCGHIVDEVYHDATCPSVLIQMDGVSVKKDAGKIVFNRLVSGEIWVLVHRSMTDILAWQILTLDREVPGVCASRMPMPR